MTAPQRARPFPARLLVTALAFPSLVTWVYFVLLREAPAALQQTAFTVGKTIQFGLPAVWCLGVLGERIGRPRWRPMPIAIGVAFGIAVGAAIGILYAFVLEPSGAFDVPAEKIRLKVEGLGLATPARFAALGVFYSLAHSLLEEYYWRWFVFRACRVRWSLPAAIVVSSVGFMAHHVILLAQYFGWSSPLTYVFSGGVAVGGAFWAWLFEREGLLVPSWISHAIVDAAVFGTGYHVVRAVLAGSP